MNRQDAKNAKNAKEEREGQRGQKAIFLPTPLTPAPTAALTLLAHS